LDRAREVVCQKVRFADILARAAMARPFSWSAYAPHTMRRPGSLSARPKVPSAWSKHVLVVALHTDLNERLSRL